jgi:glycosyltransferase involved in cell wall biosynthesis
VEGITERDDFVSSLMDCSKETQINLMRQSNGIISLSKAQNEILSSFGLKNPKTFFPASVDTKKYLPKKNNELNLSKEKINLLYLSSSCDQKDFIPFLDFMKSNSCILYIISPFSFPSAELKKEIKKRSLEKRIIFLKGLSNERLFKVIPSFDAGVYLKKFGFPFSDASFMVKISEYLSSGLPVLMPEIKGPLLQAGEAGINFEKKGKISKQELNKLSLTARNIALEKLDLKKNIDLLEQFIRKFSG